MIPDTMTFVVLAFVLGVIVGVCLALIVVRFIFEKNGLLDNER